MAHVLQDLLKTLPVWQQNHINVCTEGGLFKGKCVLEVGGQTPYEITRVLEVKSWYCVDPRIENYYSSSDGCYRLYPESVLDFKPDIPLDFIFATNSFEHITGFDKALNNMYSILTAGGKLSALFGPIWSCYKGHHVWCRVSDTELIDFNNIKLEPWAHLLYTEEEIKTMLLKEYSEIIAEKVSRNIFYSTFLNRLFYDDYKRFIEDTEFKILEFRDWHQSVYPDETTQKRLEDKYNKQNFSTVSIKILLEK